MKKLLKIFLGTLVVATLMIVILFVFRNQIVDVVIEKLGTASAGAKVEVDGVEIYLIECRMKWDRFQVTNRKDTWKNLFETGKSEFGFEFRPLLAGKMIVDTLTIDDFRTDTNRSSDGKIPEPPEPTSKNEKPSFIKSYALQQLEKEKQNIPVLNTELFDEKIDTDTIINTLELKTPGKVEALQKTAEEKYVYWEARLKNNNYEDRLKAINKDLKTVQLQKIKTVEQFNKSIAAADKVLKDSKKLRRDLKNEKKELKRDLESIANSAKQIPGWIKEDYENALKKAKLVDFSAENIARMLFGDRVTVILMAILEAIENSRKMGTGQSAADAPVKEEKMPELPKFWIKNTDITAVLQNGLTLKGTVSDISTNQKKTGKPFVIKLNGESDETGIISIQGEMDYRTEQLIDELKVVVAKLPLADISLPESPFFPDKISKAVCNISGGITAGNSDMASEIDVNMSEVVFGSVKTPASASYSSQIVGRIAEKLNSISVKCVVRSTPEKMHFDLGSNVDTVLAEEMKGIAAEEFNAAKNEIKKSLNEKLGHYQGEVDKNNTVKSDALNEMLGLVDNDSASVDKAVAAKKSVLEKKLKEKLEKKAKKAGKKLIKKLKIKL